MLNERKVRLMTQLAIYENNSNTDIRLSSYFKSDYARMQTLKTAVWVTISYVFIIGILAIYKLEFLIENAFTLDFAALGKKILGVYILVMAVYLVFSILLYSWRYKKSRENLAKYYRMLRKLNDLYDGEEEYEAEDEE